MPVTATVPVPMRGPGPSLARGELHLWTSGLDRPPAEVEQLTLALSPDERERAGRFHFERDRRRFTVGRGFLRTLLAHYLGRSAAAVTFRYGPRGKPDLAGVDTGSGLRFNLSHSGGRVLCALTRELDVGADLELIRPLDNLDSLAASVFSAGELAALHALPGPERQTAFYRCWTRKEAFIKALGDGLSWPLDSFDVTLGPGEPARLLRIAGDPGGPARWCLHALEDEGWVAAVAVAGPITAVGGGEWTWPG